MENVTNIAFTMIVSEPPKSLRNPLYKRVFSCLNQFI